MRALLDTSVIIRYLTGDIPQLAQWCAQVIDGDDDLTVTEGVLLETAYVLEKVYAVPRAVVVDRMIELLSRTNIEVTPLKKPLVVQALLFCRPSGRVSFGDALLWARASSDSLPVCTLDAQFLEEGIETVRPVGGNLA